MRLQEGNGNGQSVEDLLLRMPYIKPVRAPNGSFTSINRVWHRNVTTTIDQGVPKSPQLIAWMKRNGMMADRIGDEAADLGHEAD